MPEDAPRDRVKRSVILTRDQDTALKALASEQGSPSRNSLIRQAIDAWLKRKRR